MKKLLSFLFGSVFAFLLLECALRLLSDYPLHAESVNRVKHEILGWKLDPKMSDVDVNGFRNPEVPANVDVVVIGDSHTYGFNVDSDQSWPAQYSKLSGQSVYNMGVGGYGILHYQYLVEEALAMNPKQIILALYPCNDLIDVCGLVSSNTYWKNWVIERGYDPDSFSFKSSVSVSPWQQCLSYASKYSAAVSFLYLNCGRVFPIADSVNWESELNPGWMSLGRLVYHKESMDLQREGIKHAMNFTIKTLKEVADMARDKSVSLAVVLIPSRESACGEMLVRGTEVAVKEYQKVIEYESNCMDQIFDFCREAGIPAIDLLPHMRGELSTEAKLYPNQNNGHPLGRGYRAYAEAVWAALGNRE